MKTVAFLIFTLVIVSLILVVFLRKNDSFDSSSNQSLEELEKELGELEEPKSAFRQLASIFKKIGIFLLVASFFFAFIALVLHTSVEDCSIYKYTYEQTDCLIQNSNKLLCRNALIQLGTILFFIGTPLWYCGSKIAKIKE